MGFTSRDVCFIHGKQTPDSFVLIFIVAPRSPPHFAQEISSFR